MFQLHLHRKPGLIAGIAALAVLCVAIVSLGTPAQAAENGKLVPFKVAMVSSLDTEPYFYALKQGYYKEVGLDVTFSQTDSGPALVTGVLNGTYDAGSAAAFPILIAIGKGLPLRIYPGVTVIGTGIGNSGMVVKPGSGIKGYADLAGKKVATNALTSLTTLGLKIGLKKAGVNPDSIHVIALPFKSSVQAVARGQADAAVVISPFETIAESNGMKIVADPIGENLPKGAPYNVMFTNSKNSKAKAKDFVKFNQATLKAVKVLAANPALQRKLAQTEIGLTAAVAKAVPLPGWDVGGAINMQAFQKYADDVAEFGYTKKPVEVSKITVNP